MLGITRSAFLVYVAATLGSVGNSAFTLTDIEYNSVMIYTTPAHLAVQYGEIYFNLTNSEIPFVSGCAATERQPPEHFYGNRVYPCSTGPGNSSKTTFSYNRLENLFHVNQTWLTYGDTHSVTGCGIAEMSCETTEWTNPNWTIGNFYYVKEVKCLPTTLTIVPTDILVHW